MKAIIIAAGLGSRMKHLTNDKPKCMLELNGKSLLQIQLEKLRKAGINDISIITGYKKEKIDFPGLKYYVNKDYENNNILESLFYAEQELDGDVIISYADIIYSQHVVEQLLSNDSEISVVVDTHWQKAYVDRLNHPMEAAEHVIFDNELNVVKIGKIFSGNQDDMHGEFIGMFRLSERGCNLFKKTYHKCSQQYVNQPFQKASVFRKAYITDLLQELVDNEVSVKCSLIEGEWLELDTVEDFQEAQEAIRANLIDFL